MPKKQEQEAAQAAKDAPVANEQDAEQVQVVVVEAPAEVAYYYLPDKNPEGAFYPGVPPSDLTLDQFKAHPKWIQKAIKGSPMYRSANAGDDAVGDTEKVED